MSAQEQEVVETDEAQLQEVSNEEVDQQVEASTEEVPETEEELKDVVDKAIDEGATEEEVKDMIREFQLKVNGKTLTKKIDLSDEDSIRKELQLAAAGRQAMQEASELKKLYANEIERLKTDPYGVLAELGLDPDELAETRIQQKIEEMKKSPDQIEKEKLQKELEEARRKAKDLEEKSKQSEIQRLQEQAASQLDEEITQALDSHTDLPKSEFTVKKIADVMLWAIDNGWDDVTVEDIIPTVKQEIRREVSSMMDQFPDEALEQYIGKKNIERLRQRRLKDMKKSENVSNIKSVSKPANVKNEEPRKKVRIDDWMRL